MRSHPNVDLAEANLESFFEFLEELTGLRSIRHIDEDTYQFIAVKFVLILSEATNNLRWV
jgi:hypothetical protein